MWQLQDPACESKLTAKIFAAPTVYSSDIMGKLWEEAL